MIRNSIDLFGGAGGMGEAIAQVSDPRAAHVSIDSDRWATETARARGREAIKAKADGSMLVRMRWLGHDWHLLHASAPCTPFSQAGPEKGKGDLGAMASAVDQVMGGSLPEHAVPTADETTLLTLEPAAWIGTLRPRLVTMEQVKGALPVWEAYAEAMRLRGYHVITGLLHAEQYGVPQTRVRAWLMASLDGPVALPTPTHSRYHPHHPGRRDRGVPGWVSMAEALPHRDDLPRWAKVRPSTTVVGSFRPEVQAAPGWRKPGDPSRQNTPDSVVLTVDDAATLQGFRPGPWCGPESAQRRQIGNAVPPPVGAAVLRALDGLL